MDRIPVGGIAAYQGYDYQILATVWVALELMLKNRVCESIIVEPASGEDIAAELKVDPHEAKSALQADVNGQRIDIQVKLRRTGHWTKSAFRRVLNGKDTQKGKKGPEKRKRPLETLRVISTSKFLLITDAQVGSELRRFHVDCIGADSSATAIPGDKGTAEALARRIGILQQRLPELLEHEIGAILREILHVPATRVPDCLRALKESVRERLLSLEKKEWTSVEIIASTESSGGFPLSKPCALVFPNNHAIIMRRLAEAHRLLLTGPPGVGKTFLSQNLVHEYRIDQDPFEVVHSNEGIGRIRDCLARSGRYLFFIEDPWGHYKLAEDADRWESELPKLLRQAGPDKRFLITSRVGIRQQVSGGIDDPKLSDTEVRITEENYDAKARRKILELSLGKATPWQRDFFFRHQEKIVSRVRNPYSLVVFADKLLKITAETEADVDDLIVRCNIDVIGKEVAREIRGMGSEAVAGAVVLWSLLMANRYVLPDDASNAYRTIQGVGYPHRLDPEKLLKYLSDAAWVSKRAEGYEAHSTILEGLESLLDAEPATTEAVLLALLDGVVKSGQMELAHAIVGKLRGRELPVPRSVWEALKAHLLRKLKEASGYRLQQAFSEVADQPDPDDPVSVLVHALAVKKKTSGFDFWKPPTLTPDQVAGIRSSPEARECASKFVREIVPAEWRMLYRAPDLLAFLSNFGWDLSDDFMSASEKALQGRSSNTKVLLEGALSGPAPPYDRILDAALHALDEVFVWLDESDDERRKADQAEFDAGYASHIEEEPCERLNPIETALRAIVSIRRKAEGYEWIVEHPRRKDLLEAWVEAVEASCGRKEVEAILHTCPLGDPRFAWKAIKRARRVDMADEIIKGLVGAQSVHLNGCLEALCGLLSAKDWEEKVAPAVRLLPFPQRAAIADAAMGLNPSFQEGAEECHRLVHSVLSPEENTAVHLCRDSENPDSGPASTKTEASVRGLLLVLAGEGDELLAARAAAVLAKCGEKVSELLPRLLSSSEEGVRGRALYAAGQEDDGAFRKALLDGLDDPDYRCRRVCMWALAQNASEEDKVLVLAKAKDPSAPVRESCAQIVGQYGWMGGELVLLSLLSDKRNKSEDDMWDSIPNYHVARAAAVSLGKLNDLSDEAITGIIGHLNRRDVGRDDLVVNYLLLEGLRCRHDVRILPLFIRFLFDDWYMPGTEHAGFPLRFAAAWGIAFQLVNEPSLGEALDFDAHYSGAVDPDGRLAGPCLFSLGLAGQRAAAQILRVAGSGTLTPERALLVIAPENVSDAVRSRLIEIVGKDHPGLRVQGLTDQEPPIDESRWLEYLSRDEEASRWIAAIQSPLDVNTALRWVLHLIFQGKIDAHLSFKDLREGHFAKSLPMLTLRSMFGGE